MCRSPAPRTTIQKSGHTRARHLRRDIVNALKAAADDAGISPRALCRAAGVGPNTLLAIERDDREPTLEVLARLAAALGGELSLRFHPGTGPLVRDHLQAAMIEALLREVHASWNSEPEVLVWTPVRGSIDCVLRRPDDPIVASEAQSELRRLEQQIRWARMKADALAARGSREGTVRGRGQRCLDAPAASGDGRERRHRRAVRGDPAGRLSGRTRFGPCIAAWDRALAGPGDRVDGCEES